MIRLSITHFADINKVIRYPYHTNSFKLIYENEIMITNKSAINLKTPIQNY